MKSTSARASLLCGCLALSCILGFCSTALAADWQGTVSKDPPGRFPEPRPLRAKYNFGWGGFTAATGEVRFTKPTGDRLAAEGTGRTVGLARALWKFDVNFRALADANTLRPIEAKQSETHQRKKLVTQLAFTGTGVTRARTETPSKSGPGKPKQFNYPNLFDLHAALLYLRSQPLKDRSVHRVVVYPTTTPYLATITVLGREKVSTRAGAYNAIKMDLQLSRVGKNLQLEPHRKFRRATVWISDDADRLVLRAEAQIFVGTVFAELQSVQFDKPR